jgi:aspartate kinase
VPETVVLKFGGTSVRDDLSREAAVAHVRRSVEEGKRTVVVVSAMGREGEPYATDSLIKLMRSTGEPVSPRELDLAISTGEIPLRSILRSLSNHE